MNDAVFSILIEGIETLLLPSILRWLKKRFARRRIVYALLVLIVLLMTMVIGSTVSVLAYHFSKS